VCVYIYMYIYIYIPLLLHGEVSPRRINNDLLNFQSHFLYARILSQHLMNASRCEKYLSIIFRFIVTSRIARLKYLDLFNNSKLCWV
jgi:hypothetical protein